MKGRAKAPRGLVAVSDAKARDAAARALERIGYVVETSSEWADTMGRVGSESFAVVIAEVEMPVVGGFNLLKAIRSNHPATLVFLLGRNGGDEVAKHAADLGAAGYVRKPVDERVLAARVKEVRDEVRNRQVLSSLGIKGGRLRPVA